MRRPRQHRDPDNASTMLPSSDLGRFDPPRVEQHRPVKRWEERQSEALANQNALLNMWQQTAESIGGLLALTKANAPGDALGTGTELIGAGGANERRFPGNFQSVAVTNFSAGTLVVAAAPAQSQAPSVGPGVYNVPAGCYRVVPLRGSVVTVYGIANAAYDLTTYSKPRPMDFASAGGIGGSLGSGQTLLSNSSQNAAAAGGNATITPPGNKTAYLTDLLITSTGPSTAGDYITLTGTDAPGGINLMLGTTGTLVWQPRVPIAGLTPGAPIALTVIAGGIATAYALTLAGFAQ
jgi:hypothetical protein